MATSIAKGAELEGSLETAGWSNFELLRNVPAAHRATADEILGEVRVASAGDEYSQPLATALRGAQFKATHLVQTMLQERQPPADRSPAPPAPSPVVDRTLPPGPVPPVVVPPVVVPDPSRSTSPVTGLVTGPGSAGGSGTTPSPSARQVVSQEKRENLSLEEAQAELARLQQQRRPGQAVRVSLGWVIDEETR
jgi:hypothetical protein